MTISVRLSHADTELFRAYAAMHNQSVSEMVRKAVMEKIEDEYDLKCYDEAIKAYHENPATYTLEEVEKELELDEL